MTSKNWRDIDLAKDRGVKTERKKSALVERAEKKASAEAKKNLEKLFQDSPLNKEKSAEVQRIQSLRGKPEFYSAMSAYIEKYGQPREWELISLFLDHRDSKFVIELLKSLNSFVGRWPMDRQQLLAQKLKVMEVSCFDPELMDHIQETKNSILFK